ncbi:SDR family NAD(P)-dependent oxidoreductase [Pseudonocardia sp. TRM90224]|uniref:SDR family NAD(P)-dependent oxidoreductase n=1 Tax=Pseudonocardia sp. TRM90224 TaxID=2812678 RepID=UPI001E5440C3|nr:SDR family NAD(P)-dependent oxidoreductase [Pseudonocardia sp. TRM90224]
MRDLLDLRERVAFVTGSTRGIGWATAQLLAEHGASVVVAGSSDLAAAEARAKELTAGWGTPALGVVCDSREPAQIKAAYRTIHQTFKRLDVLVNSAGVLDDALIGMISDDALENTFRVNAIGPIQHLQAAARLMRRSGDGGSIINIASIIGVTGNEGQAVYGASKAAVIGLTRSAAKELAPMGVRVNAIAPGFIDTDMTRALPEAKFAQRAAAIKMGRVGTADDVARAVLFLASDLSGYVTGTVLGVDGGMLI